MKCGTRTAPKLPTVEHIRVIRHALGVDFCPTPCANTYVAGFEEFSLLEEMIRRGLMEYSRSVLDCRCYRVTDRGARVVGLEKPTSEQIRWWPHPVPSES